ncbi:zona pellucida sperm-binding protein 3-like [Engraulis encrasicolus]|uniref:zona pellucida sperm-binding protein 3-like n=1 Tax=Engraulis encrasicolus TaxID=184585 RepID=UPI002FD610CA
MPKFVSNLFRGAFLAIACCLMAAFPATDAYPFEPFAKEKTPSPPPTPAPTTTPLKAGVKGKGGDERRPETLTVKVECHPDYMAIEMDADLLELGFAVDFRDLRLGKSEGSGESCKAYPTQPGKYMIAAALTDCGTLHQITEEYLLYSNTLEYAPAPSADGVVRAQPVSFSIECYYKRKFELSSISVQPTWIPFMSTRAHEGQLDFSLILMTDDWSAERSPGVYFLGDSLHLRASVQQFHHHPMRVFVSGCVATLTPDPTSQPSYDFIQNDGCLMDSYLTGSESHFLPRRSPGELLLALDAFRFHDDERSELYITCQLKAVPVDLDETTGRACTFADDGWLSADGNHGECMTCLQNDEPISKQSSSSKRSPAPSSHSSTSLATGHSSDAKWGYGYDGSSVQTSDSRRQQVGYFQPRAAGGSKDAALARTPLVLEKEKSVGPITVLKHKIPQTPEAIQTTYTEQETKSSKMGPRSTSPLAKELSKPDDKDDGFASQFIDLWKKRASPKDWAEMMALLQQASQDPPSVSSTTTAAEGPKTHDLPDVQDLIKVELSADFPTGPILPTPAPPPAKDMTMPGAPADKP